MLSIYCINAVVLVHLVPAVGAGSYGIGFGNGGPVSTVWGWVLVAVMTSFVGLAMAEIVSALPSSGGPYFWASVLGGDRWGPLAAWVTGKSSKFFTLGECVHNAYTCCPLYSTKFTRSSYIVAANVSVLEHLLAFNADLPEVVGIAFVPCSCGDFQKPCSTPAFKHAASQQGLLHVLLSSVRVLVTRSVATVQAVLSGWETLPQPAAVE